MLSKDTIKGTADTKKALSKDKASDYFSASLSDQIFGSGTINNIQQKIADVKKTTTIQVSDITKENRTDKIEMLKKCLNKEPFEKIIADDNDFKLGNVILELKGLTPDKIEKAIRTMSFSLDVPLKAAKGEVFLYQAQEDLTTRWASNFSQMTRSIYDLVINYFGLPEVTVMAKAEEYLRYQGKVLYSPETGEPIPQKKWDQFVKTLEDFLNRKVSGSDKKIILESKALGKILNRMLKYNTLEAVKNIPLEELKYHNKTFDWISDNIKNLQLGTGNLTRQEQARIQVMTQSAGQRITKLSDAVKSDVKQILIDGVKARKGKSQVSQALFDKMVGHNRDFQKIADTEIQNAVNNAFLQEEIFNAETDEKVYFKRVEAIDEHTCAFCKKMNGKIVLWSNTPLTSDKIKNEFTDVAIWEGKEWTGKKNEVCTGVFHPFCRGTWVRWAPGDKKIDALVAGLSENTRQWNNAIKTANKEFAEKGIETPDDNTPGYKDRIQELYNDNTLKKSLTFSGHKLQGRRKFQGLNISIENRRGSLRSGIDRDGHKWSIKMKYPYGYIRGTVGVDGDHLDCYLGDNENAENVYIVHQNHPDTGKYDEDKCMLGFDTIEEAKRAYLSQYDRPGFLGSIDTVPVEVFKRKILLKRFRKQKLSI